MNYLGSQKFILRNLLIIYIILSIVYLKWNYSDNNLKKKFFFIYLCMCDDSVQIVCLLIFYPLYTCRWFPFMYISAFFLVHIDKCKFNDGHTNYPWRHKGDNSLYFYSFNALHPVNFISWLFFMGFCFSWLYGSNLIFYFLLSLFFFFFNLFS